MTRRHPSRRAGRERVWDYPRPPRLEPTARELRVVLGGEVIARTTRALRVLETSHPPTYYFPPEDVERSCLSVIEDRTACEWKGWARLFDVVAGGRRAARAAWCYPQPTAGFADLRDHVAFMPAGMDECTVDGERVRPQAGGFYGGWITADLEGPFKGEPGTSGW